MARGVNLVILLGNLGKDPEFRSFSNGGSVASAAIATSDTWKDRDGNPQERTEWHSLVFHNRLAEIARDYLRKGSKIYVEGKLRTRKWEDKEGKDRYITEIHVEELQMLDGKQSDTAQPSQGSTQTRARNRPPPTKTPVDEFHDDDIPF